MVTVDEIRRAQRAGGPATVLAIGTANPFNCYDQNYQLTKPLGLGPSVKRFMMYQQGCFGGGTTLRLAKDLAENNKDPIMNVERPLFELIFATQILPPDSGHAITGGRAILDQFELKLGLKPDKLKATRNVMSEYGNMGSACVLFVLDEMRKTSIKAGLGTTGEGLEWGVLFGFGSGLTIEAVVLRSISI
ncbi:hypothetical protein HAX54_024686 [Datura stramonium]|uniref:Chalcone/stilbene synthase C-terminal domain-containing protein n=1 Tax=Datura stramonium TaxID=4076 RepID=A0ABS8RGF3_DATST|nr:hypothetical protein [Datura stramonium]